MDKTVLAEVLAVVLAGSIMTLLFPDGKYKNLLKMLSGFAVAVGIISLFSGFLFLFPNFPNTLPKTVFQQRKLFRLLPKTTPKKLFRNMPTISKSAFRSSL